MKKTLFMFAALVMLATNASAQFSNSKSSKASSDDSKWAVGVNVLYGTEIESVGFGVKGQRNYAKAFRGELSFAYFLGKNDMSAWNINVNLHYLFPLSQNIKVYPLAGLGYAYGNNYAKKIETGEDFASAFASGGLTAAGKFCTNLGGGIDFDISDSWIINFEGKYQYIKNQSQGVFSVGAAYKF